MTAKKIMFAVSALLLVLAAICKFALVGYGFMALVLFAMAVALALFAILPRTLRFILLAGICIFLILFSSFEYRVFQGSKGVDNQDADYIIVLGAAVHGDEPSLTLRDRINGAEEYLKKYPNSVAVLSGGQGEGENISEARAMRDALKKKGIDESRLVMEDKSTSTIENLRFSVDKLTEHRKAYLTELMTNDLEKGRELEKKPLKIVILSSEYHLFRARYVARRALGLDMGSYPAKTTLPGIRLTNFLREGCGMIAMKWYELTGRL